MEKKMNEVDQLLGDLGKPEQAFKEPEITEEVPPKEEESEGKKNRRHRRLEEKYQAERDANIALNARLQALSEVDRPRVSDAELPDEWVALYGDTPEARKAWKVQEKLFESYGAKAREEALEEFESKQRESFEEQKKYESLIDSELEALEDEYDVDLTSNAPKAKKMREEFLELVGKLSPKDEEGNPIQYADFQTTFEIYQEKRSQKDKPDNSRQKELASRSSLARTPSAPTETKTGPMTFDRARREIDRLFRNN